MSHVSACVMHHESRADRIPGLLRALGEDIEVVADPQPFGAVNPWRCAFECWDRTPPDADWRLVIQDDVLPCRDFLAGAARALELAPAPIVCFYLGWNPHATARMMLVRCDQDSSWVEGQHGEWVPTVCTAIRSDVARELCAFQTPTQEIGDDTVLGHFVAATKTPWVCTIPSLAQHDDDEPSTLGGHRMHPHARQAACFIGDHSALDVDWTRGL